MTYCGARARIERTENGWVVWGSDGNGGISKWVFGDDPDEPATNLGPGYTQSLLGALWQVVECLDAAGSRYDPDRIDIGTRPGDKS